MKLITPSEEDKAQLNKMLNDTIVPKWAARCSAECVSDFNDTVGKVIGVTAKK